MKGYHVEALVAGLKDYTELYEVVRGVGEMRYGSHMSLTNGQMCSLSFIYEGDKNKDELEVGLESELDRRGVVFEYILLHEVSIGEIKAECKAMLDFMKRVPRQD